MPTSSVRQVVRTQRPLRGPLGNRAEWCRRRSPLQPCARSAPRPSVCGPSRGLEPRLASCCEPRRPRRYLQRSIHARSSLGWSPSRACPSPLPTRHRAPAHPRQAQHRNGQQAGRKVTFVRQQGRQGCPHERGQDHSMERLQVDRAGYPLSAVIRQTRKHQGRQPATARQSVSSDAPNGRDSDYCGANPAAKHAIYPPPIAMATGNPVMARTREGARVTCSLLHARAAGDPLPRHRGTGSCYGSRRTSTRRCTGSLSGYPRTNLRLPNPYAVSRLGSTPFETRKLVTASARPHDNSWLKRSGPVLSVWPEIENRISLSSSRCMAVANSSNWPTDIGEMRSLPISNWI